MTTNTTTIRFDDFGYIAQGDNESTREFLGVIRRVARTIERCCTNEENHTTAGVVGILRIATNEAGMFWPDFREWTDEQVYNALTNLERRIQEDPDIQWCC